MSQANMPQNTVMIDPDDAVMLLIDHQSGLFNLVKDIPVPDLPWDWSLSYPLCL